MGDDGSDGARLRHGRGRVRLLGRVARTAAIVPLALAACATPPEPGLTVLQPPDRPYAFPWVNPYAATVVRTPPVLRADLPQDIPASERRLKVFPDRVVPEVFWYDDALRFSLVSQRGEAPLIFIIAGTGSTHDSRLTTIMQRAFFDAGFHVIALPSPTHPNFIVNASTTSVPGRIGEDARDLYRAMQLAYARVGGRIAVSTFHLTGFSLGGWQAAYVARLDSEEGVFGFDKVLMINPPVSLYTSIRLLDAMLTNTLPDGPSAFNALIDDVFAKFSQISPRLEAADFDELVYRAYVEFAPDDAVLQALVGLAFRFSSNNMVFAADVMTGAGYVVPAGTRLDSLSSLSPFFDRGMTLSFENYLDHFLYPYYKAREPGLDREDLIAEASLVSIEDYLAAADHIGLLTNEDDIVLAPGEIDYLRALFGPRARVFPTGGHLGNLDDPHFVHAMTSFFRP